jgi:hypothetical protein
MYRHELIYFHVGDIRSCVHHFDVEAGVSTSISKKGKARSFPRRTHQAYSELFLEYVALDKEMFP